MIINQEIQRQNLIEFLKKKELPFELEFKRKTRSSQQNRALHLYFKYISNELTNLGMTFNYSGVKGLPMETPYTYEIVKNFIWRPIQIALFNIESTTKITTSEINIIIDVINKFFGEKGVFISFPSYESLLYLQHER